MINKGRPLPKNIVARPHLFNRIDLLLKNSSIWLSANAGSGKTSLISSYIEHRNLTCFWCQLDTGERVMPAAEMVVLRRQAAELLSHLEEW